jgi:hypothetical protein
VEKILTVGPVPPPYGGIASLMDEIIHSDLSSEFEFEVFDRSRGFPLYAKGPMTRNIFRLKRFLAFFKKVLTRRYHCVHIHSADPVFLGTTIFMILARLAGVKVLLHMQGTHWGDFYGSASTFRKFYTRIGLL